MKTTTEVDQLGYRWNKREDTIKLKPKEINFEVDETKSNEISHEALLGPIWINAPSYHEIQNCITKHMGGGI